VRFRYEEERDAREVLGEQALDEDAVADLDRRMARLDGLRPAPWTRATLEAIATRPRTRAARLAETLGRETPEFKVDVRKLKALGLTRSLEVGYELSPRGAAYIERLRARS
jgi:hypothetical protein